MFIKLRVLPILISEETVIDWEGSVNSMGSEGLAASKSESSKEDVGKRIMFKIIKSKSIWLFDVWLGFFRKKRKFKSIILCKKKIIHSLLRIFRIFRFRKILGFELRILYFAVFWSLQRTQLLFNFAFVHIYIKSI